jgi:hypothetical protein
MFTNIQKVLYIEMIFLPCIQAAKLFLTKIELFALSALIVIKLEDVILLRKGRYTFCAHCTVFEHKR